MSSLNQHAPWRGQISVAGILIGCIGCVIITASSVYTALKMGALPWPTIFTSITALVLLRAAGRTSLNEANVTQIIMSAGSMVAGGLAFTIPGVWMLGLDAELSWIEIGGVALAGTLLGLVCTALIRRRFVEESDLEYPIGTAAAARRPMIERRAPERVIGRSTRSAMQSGVVLGEAARSDGLLDAVMDELGADVPVVLTGDGAAQVAALISHDAVVDETLTLRGLHHIWLRNRH